MHWLGDVKRNLYWYVGAAVMFVLAVVVVMFDARGWFGPLVGVGVLFAVMGREGEGINKSTLKRDLHFYVGAALMLVLARIDLGDWWGMTFVLAVGVVFAVILREALLRETERKANAATAT